MEQKKILLLEDDPNLGFLLQENLELQGFQVRRCANGLEGAAACRETAFDLCLVDVMMPRQDGFTFAAELRQRDQRTPLIFLTAKSLKEDKITGFKLGCDDYITKPFSLEELVLRIQAVLKRAAPGPAALPNDRFTFGRCNFDSVSQTLELDGRQHKLTPKESALLRLLCLHRNEVLERETALRLIWGEDSYFNGRSMDVYISKLRKYLSADPNLAILNVHGRGFKLVVR
ncbi:MAG: Transcriptional regulatory protein SrrA [bacterium]|nr:Transcriptional regulatory protein SrrA [bacterium]